MEQISWLLLPKLIVIFCLGLSLQGCRKETGTTATPSKVDPLAAADMPVLPVSPGQQWKYVVTVENPNDPRTGGQTRGQFERLRRYVGKIDPGNGKPPTDCFEVSAEGAATWREFVEINPDEVLIVGQAQLESGGAQKPPIWFEHPIPYFKAGLLAGDSMPLTVLNKDKNLWRGTRVIGREKTQVPAGEYETVRLQMFGLDGRVSLRKTYWFAPGKGIIREEKIREVDGKPVMIETDELLEMTPAPSEK